MYRGLIIEVFDGDHPRLALECTFGLEEALDARLNDAAVALAKSRLSELGYSTNEVGIFINEFGFSELPGDYHYADGVFEAQN